MIIEGTVLVLAIASRCLVAIDAFLSLQAMAFLLEVAADWDFVFLIHVEILALFSTLTLLLQPVDADNLFYFRFVAFQTMGLIDSNKLVKTHDVHLY